MCVNVGVGILCCYLRLVQIGNHGVCPEVIDGALNAVRSLFELAREEK